MSAEQRPIIKDIEEHKKTWRQLWLNMAEGDITRYNEIKRLDCLTEFWIYFDSWRDKQKKLIDDYKKQKRH